MSCQVSTLILLACHFPLRGAVVRILKGVSVSRKHVSRAKGGRKITGQARTLDRIVSVIGIQLVSSSRCEVQPRDSKHLV